MSVRAERGATTSDQPPHVSVRFYRPSDDEGILRVLQASFPRWPEVETDVAPIDHLRWKLASGTRIEMNHIVADIDGQIVGVRLGIALKYAIQGRRFSARCDVDSCVLPEFRGHGVYARMIEAGNEITSGFDLYTTSTDRPSIVEMDGSLGHRPIGNRLVMMTCDLAIAPYRPLQTGPTITRVDRLGAPIEPFWARASDPFNFIVAPSMADLNWRYCDSRGGTSIVLQAEESGEIVGFAALRVSRGKGYIAYLLALPGQFEAVRAMVRAALAHFRERGVADASCALPWHHPYSSLLVQEGFTRKSHTIPFSCRPIYPDQLDLSFLRKPKAPIHVMLGDTDLI